MPIPGQRSCRGARRNRACGPESSGKARQSLKFEGGLFRQRTADAQKNNATCGITLVHEAT